ncbi:MAG: RNA-binding cell elongation regulator Jag/EloR, partial [Clostridia bacterium]|nr:RNA-binding cell elongation regulator Jag/EloR [Clostridia bacterium]
PAEQKDELQPKPEEQAGSPEALPDAQQAKAPRAGKPRPQKPRPPKEPKPVQEGALREERDYAPMIPAQPFAPTEPPVIHDENTAAGRAQRFLMDVTARMNVKVDVYVDDSREDSLYIHMIGDTLGILIGRRGETLDALQYLTSLQVNKGREGYTRVTLDTENYRAKREDSLRRLAQRMANRAQKTGRKVVLEPMNPYERRVLHTALQNHPAVTTHSEGEEPNRRVVIMLRNQPERADRADKPERATQGDKPAGTRNRRRRGRRGGRPAGNAPAAEAAIAPEQTVNQLGEEE